jgi:prolyl oligopeptidase
MREKKPNVFDDYLAILAELKRKGMDVVGLGGSNGGLLMGATMNARPDLFSGVLIGYPVLDMMAYHRLLLGKAWVPEYGDPDNPRDRKFLMKYSPYHNILSGRKYPPVFIYTGLKDDRVHPSHAFKFHAKLKETGANVALRVETKSGHSGTTPETRIRETADKLAFAYQSLGLTA